MACPTRRSRTDCSSAARPSSTTSPTCWRSSACAAVPRRPRTRPGPRNRGPHRSRTARAAPLSAQVVREECAMYDAIVVGARCAGSPTAMLLARQGYRVLLVDRAEFPSDTVSTHVVHAPGVAALHGWGLLDAGGRLGRPPIDTYSFDFGPLHDHRHAPARGRLLRRVRATPHRARQDPRRRRSACRRGGTRAIHRRWVRGRGRRGGRRPRSRTQRRGRRRAGPCRDRRRRSQLGAGPDCARQAV